jgi:hypothetical protein
LTFFFITRSLLSVSPPGRNDANSFIRLVTEFNAVSYQQKQYALHHSYRLPAMFATVDLILFYKSVGIVENVSGDLEADPVLSPIGPRLGNIPLEPYLAPP